MHVAPKHNLLSATPWGGVSPVAPGASAPPPAPSMNQGSAKAPPALPPAPSPAVGASPAATSTSVYQAGAVGDREGADKPSSGSVL